MWIQIANNLAYNVKKMCFWYVFEKELTGKDFMKKIYWELGIAEKNYWELGILTPPLNTLIKR